MGFGRLYKNMEPVVSAAVAGRRVLDLGCGDGLLSMKLLDLGAVEVVAVDKGEVSPPWKIRRPGLCFVNKYFHELDPDMVRGAVVFLSWPDVYMPRGLSGLVRGAESVIYLGCNRGGTACGTPDLFRLFLLRKLVSYVGGRTNSLVVMGTQHKDGTLRAPTPEEMAGMDRHEIYDWTPSDEAQWLPPSNP